MPSDKYLKELWTMSVAKIFLWKFPADSKYRQRPPGIKDMDWNNHLNSLLGIICGIKKFFVEDKSFTDLMLELKPEKLVWFEHLMKKTAYTYLCRGCKTVQSLNERRRAWF